MSDDLPTRGSADDLPTAADHDGAGAPTSVTGPARAGDAERMLREILAGQVRLAVNDFAPLKDDPRFKALVAEVAARNAAPPQSAKPAGGTP